MEVNGSMHFFIVKQLTIANVFSPLGLSTFKHSISIKGWKCTIFTKVGKNKHILYSQPLIFNDG